MKKQRAAPRKPRQVKVSKSLRQLRIRQIDATLKPFVELRKLARPHRGWIREIRQALGMTATQLARRLNVSQPAVVALENSEQKGGITLKTLGRVADALDADLVYAIVPRRGLDETLLSRIRQVAAERVSRVAHTMALEAQQVSDEYTKQQVDELIQQMIASPPKDLW